MWTEANKITEKISIWFWMFLFMHKKASLWRTRNMQNCCYLQWFLIIYILSCHQLCYVSLVTSYVLRKCLTEKLKMLGSSLKRENQSVVWFDIRTIFVAKCQSIIYYNVFQKIRKVRQILSNVRCHERGESKRGRRINIKKPSPNKKGL